VIENHIERNPSHSAYHHRKAAEEEIWRDGGGRKAENGDNGKKIEENQAAISNVSAASAKMKSWPIRHHRMKAEMPKAGENVERHGLNAGRKRRRSHGHARWRVVSASYRKSKSRRRENGWHIAKKKMAAKAAGMQ